MHLARLQQQEPSHQTLALHGNDSFYQEQASALTIIKCKLEDKHKDTLLCLREKEDQVRIFLQNLDDFADFYVQVCPVIGVPKLGTLQLSPFVTALQMRHMQTLIHQLEDEADRNNAAIGESGHEIDALLVRVHFPSPCSCCVCSCVPHTFMEPAFNSPALCFCGVWPAFPLAERDCSV